MPWNENDHRHPMQFRLIPLLAAFLVLLAGPGMAQVSHGRSAAVALVDRATLLLQTTPRPAALAELSKPHGSFVDGELYVYVLDARDGQLTMLAHGANPGLIGMPQNEIVDADGRAFNDETLTVVKTKGEGWVTYRWPNPVTRKIAVKSSFVRLVGDVIIGVGVYQ